MMDPVFVITAACLVGLTVIAYSLLKAWHGWLELKREELDRHQGKIDQGPGNGLARIEMADLKERIKKLESIASGVDL